MLKAYTAKISPTHARESFYKVWANGTVIGFLTKYPNTRTEKHPWKAFGAKTVSGQPVVDHDAEMKAFYSGKADAVTYLAQKAGL